MSILATLRQSRAGEWKNLDEYLRELRHRETGALAALANALTAPPHEQKELVAHGEGGAILLEVACDLRVPKGARLAASRALLEAGIAEPFVGHLFIGAGDLVTDPRLGANGAQAGRVGAPLRSPARWRVRPGHARRWRVRPLRVRGGIGGRSGTGPGAVGAGEGAACRRNRGPVRARRGRAP